MSLSRVTKPIMALFNPEKKTLTLLEMVQDFELEVGGYDHSIRVSRDVLSKDVFVYEYSLRHHDSLDIISLKFYCRPIDGDTATWAHDNMIAQILRHLTTLDRQPPLPCAAPTPAR